MDEKLGVKGWKVMWGEVRGHVRCEVRVDYGKGWAVWYGGEGTMAGG